MLMKQSRLLPHARRVRMFELLQSPGSGIKPAPGVTTGREPRPPVADVLQTAGRQQTALEFMAGFRPFGFIYDPIGGRQNARCRAAEPFLVAGEAVMLGQTPQNPAMMLIVAP